MIYKKLILLSLFFSVTILGQTSPHIISGIDLNKDWYTLTNQSALSYYSQEIYRKDKNLDGVTMNISDDYMTSLVDDDFLKIGFTNISHIRMLTGLYFFKGLWFLNLKDRKMNYSLKEV